MKDRQIKNFLSLKRQLESIRHDSLVFSEQYETDSRNQGKSQIDCKIKNDETDQRASISKLFSIINYSLQSIEFKSNSKTYFSHFTSRLTVGLC